MAPRILLSSIAMGAYYSFEVINIDIWAPIFFKHNNQFISTLGHGGREVHFPPANWFRQPFKQLGWSNDGRLESDEIFECVSLLLYPKDAINSLLASIKTSTHDHKAWKTNMVYKKRYQ